MIFRRAGILAAILALTSSAAFSADCLMGRYAPDQQSFTSEKLQMPIALNWEYTGSKFDNNPASPVVVGRVCYFACGTYLYAIDLDTGNKKWQYPSEQPLSSPIKSTPAIYEDNIYFSSVDGNLYCIDAETGRFEWAFQTRGPIRCSPVVIDGVVYVAADDNSVYAIDAETGDATWNRPFVAKDDFAQGIAIGSGMAVVACMDGNLYGLSLSTGKLRWMARLSEAPVRTAPIIVDNQVVMAIGGVIYGFTVRSGQMKWMIKLPHDAAASPASDGVDIYIPCTDKKIYAYTLTGRQPTMKWTSPADIGTNLMSNPIVADKVVFVAGSKGTIAGYSTEDGSLKWRYGVAPSTITSPGQTYTDAASSPTVANGNLLVLTDDGVLHCFSTNAPDGEPPVDFNLVPATGSAMSGMPPIKISAVLYDIGSGVDFDGLTMMLDGSPVDCKKDPSTFTVSYVTEVGGEGKAARKLLDGIHNISISAKDYAGNQLNREWFFYVDNTLPPPKRAVPAETGKKTTTDKKNSRNKPSRGFNAPRQSYSSGSTDSGASAPPPPPPPMPAIGPNASGADMPAPPSPGQ
ncbi:PQQ-binding-like beta-propeller repeat protein [bacterium]|nr:PQQ-binding-like beta-propeller repeat protein [bacterium]